MQIAVLLTIIFYLTTLNTYKSGGMLKNYESFNFKSAAARYSLLAACLLMLSGGISRAQVHWVERPDNMFVYFLQDFDYIGERVRILYQTVPTPGQSQADPEGWTINVYVVEARPDGSVEQYHLASRQEHYAALRLRRGHDQVLVVRRPVNQGGPQRLEVWSSQDGMVASTALAPLLPGAGGDRLADLTYITSTSDGNLFVTAQRMERSSRGGKPVGLGWYKLSPDGEILGRGEYRHGNARLMPRGSFPARDGGIGLTLQLQMDRDSEGLETDIDTPIKRTIGGRTLEAEVFSETRMLVADGDAKLRWLSPALERSLIWGGEMAVAEDLPFQERMEQLNEQMRLTENIELEYGARRTLEHIATANNDLIQWSPGGYGMLAAVVANRRREPPAHGPYFLEVGRDGSLRREIYLNPVAETLDADFSNFLPGEDGGMLLVGMRRSGKSREKHIHATQVDAAGNLQWTTRLSAPAGEIDGIAGIPANTWVFGHAVDKRSNKTVLWLERVKQTDTGP